MMTQHVAHRASDPTPQGNGLAALSRELFDTMRFAGARGMSKADLRVAADLAMLRMFGIPKDGTETVDRERGYYDKAPGI